MKTTRLVLWAVVWCLAACGGSGVSTCGSDDDCRDGFICGTGPFEGECVQFVQVQTCGAAYCERGRETCENGACVPLAPGRDAQVGTTPGTDSGPGPAPDPDDGVPPISTDDQGVAPPNDGGVPVEPDADPRIREPSILIDEPLTGSQFVDQAVTLRGEVLNLAAQAQVTWRLDDDPTKRPIEIPGAPFESTFRVVLDVPPGRHVVTVGVEQGPYSVEASVEFRADWFVRARGTQLLLNETPWRFVGLATPDLRELTWQHVNSGGTDRVAEVLGEARRLGATVLRVPACDDRIGNPAAIQTGRGTYNESGLVALDWVITRAGEAGLKLVMPLVDGTDQLGGIPQYLRWAGYLVPVPSDRALFLQPGPIREHFKQYVRAILERRNSINGLLYAEDPTILGWEVFTRFEAQGLYGAPGGGAEVADFLSDVTQVMKSAAPRALIGTGEIGYDLMPAAYGRAVEEFGAVGLARAFDGHFGISWQRNLRLATVDFGSLELVPDRLGIPVDPNLWSSLGASWIRSHAALAATIGKPVVVSLAGVNRALLDPAQRSAALDAWLDEATSQNLAGFMAGHFRADGFDAPADPYGFSWTNDSDPADPRNEPLLVTIQRAAQGL